MLHPLVLRSRYRDVSDPCPPLSPCMSAPALSASAPRLLPQAAQASLTGSGVNPGLKVGIKQLPSVTLSDAERAAARAAVKSIASGTSTRAPLPPTVRPPARARLPPPLLPLSSSAGRVTPACEWPEVLSASEARERRPAACPSSLLPCRPATRPCEMLCVCDCEARVPSTFVGVPLRRGIRCPSGSR